MHRVLRATATHLKARGYWVFARRRADGDAAL